MDSNKRPSTISSYVAALKTVLREDQQEIKEDWFLLNSLIRACRLGNHSVKIRLPIQKPLLHILLKQVAHKLVQCEQPQLYLASMYKALFASAYYGLLRIGEVAQGEHPILAKDTHIGMNKAKVMFILRTSKTHCESDMPQTVKISSTKLLMKNENRDKGEKGDHCPYQLLRGYLNCRPKYTRDEEQFFVFRDCSPIKTSHVAKMLKDLLRDCQIDNSKFSFHGFRAGRGVNLLKLGVSVETIKKIGRWRSNAVFHI